MCQINDNPSSWTSPIGIASALQLGHAYSLAAQLLTKRDPTPLPPSPFSDNATRQTCPAQDLFGGRLSGRGGPLVAGRDVDFRVLAAGHGRVGECQATQRTSQSRGPNPDRPRGATAGRNGQ